MKFKIYMHLHRVAWICFFSLYFTTMQAQDRRPKIGLTLSGGGAKGLSHIGILKAIDSAGLKIDYITGTSMGSVVGAMYAAGYSGNSIETIARKLDWDLLFSSSPQLNAIRIEEKSEYDKYIVELPFEKGKFKLGRGFIAGQELWLKLAELFSPVYNVSDFSKLPIPFRCIGTDLETGDAVVMDHGSIVTAIRASMAIPSVFTPVVYENKLLVDGGVVNNFPVLDVKQMGADYVIGVNLNQGLLKADKLESSLDILLQIGFFKDAATFEKHKAQCDLYIQPDLKSYSTASFAFSDSIIDIGVETGRLYYPYFKKLADSLNAVYGHVDFIKDRLPKDNDINISKYSVEGLNNTGEEFFFGQLDLKKNKDYAPGKINTAVRNVYGSRYYTIIRYNFLPGANDSTEMHFTVKENPLTAVKFGLYYNDFTKVGLKLNITARDLLLKESRATVTAALSQYPRVYAEYFKHIGQKRTTRAVFDYYFESSDFPAYKDFELLERFTSIRHFFDFQFQHNLNRSSYIGIGQQYLYTKIKTVEAPRAIAQANNSYWYTYLSYRLNSNNRKNFPTSGWDLKTEVGYVYGQDPKYESASSVATVSLDSSVYGQGNYWNLYVNAIHYSKLNSKFSWSQRFSLALIRENHPNIMNAYLVGGTNEVIRNQVPFVGLNESEVKTGSIASLQFGLQYALAKKLFLTGRFNAALYDFYGSVFYGNNEKNKVLSGYGLSFGYNSLIGPIEFTLMYCDQDTKVKTNINIGFSF